MWNNFPSIFKNMGTSCTAGLPVTNSISFYLTEGGFFSLSFLKAAFLSYKILCWHLFSFNILLKKVHCPLVPTVSVEKSLLCLTLSLSDYCYEYPFALSLKTFLLVVVLLFSA